jgi:AAA+ superfamily predicted ATPase
MEQALSFTSHLYFKSLKRLLDNNYFPKLDSFEDRLICGLLLIQTGPFPKENKFLQTILMSNEYSKFSSLKDSVPQEVVFMLRKNPLREFLKKELKTNKYKRSRAHKILKDIILRLEKSYAGSEVELRLNKLQALIGCSDNDIDALVTLVHLKLLGSSVNKMPLFTYDYRETDRYNERVFKREQILSLMGLSKLQSTSILESESVLVQGRLVESIRFDMISISETIFNYLTADDKADVNNILQLEKRGSEQVYGLDTFSLGKDEIDLCASLLKTNSKKIILIEGSDGTGKTEFAKSLVKAVGKECLWIPSSKASDGEDALKNRRSTFQLASLVCSPKDSVVVLDEADEVLSSRMDNPLRFLNPELSTNKDILNGIFDRAKAQIIIILNKNTLDNSVLRRCSIALKFPELFQDQRLKMIENTFSEYGVQNLLTQDEKNLIANKFDLSQGVVGLALKDSLMMGTSPESQKDYFIKLLNSRHQFLRGEGISFEEESDMYSPDLIKTSLSVEEIEQKCKFYFDVSSTRWKPSQLTFLFHGPSGCGKTAFVQYLSKRHKRKLITVSGSSLQDKYVGGTEEKIRNLFQSAERNQSILFIDELDSLLRERRGEDKRYEVSQVNEFLVSLEKFKGVFIGATNFTSILDPALSRRFSDKVEFLYPDLDARTQLVTKYFINQLETKDTDLKELLRELNGLTPGHVKAVKQALAHKEYITIDTLHFELKKAIGKIHNRMGL